jgi:hypothetical protein
MEHVNRYLKTEMWPLTPGEIIRILHTESPIVNHPIHRVMPSPHFAPAAVSPNTPQPEPSGQIAGDSVASQIDEPAKDITPHNQKSPGEEHEID